MWTLVWLVFAAWTPSFFWPWRGFILRAFGAKIHPTAIVRSSVRIWWPAHLSMEAHSSLGPGVICYNVAPISLGAFATISQRAHLCTGTHDIDDPNFPLRAKPIRIGAKAWVAAEAFVGPGVSIGEGAVLGARGVAFRDLKDWTVSVGNPASAVKMRQPT
ncbi:putative colanic acid biosynthesis acetyltransferase [Paraburkholderia aspalathi]|nr:putative colanic acid biosynthesis acetyltransferase [Paraburkholderia aspalathi]